MERMKWGESECVGRRGCPKYLVAAHLLMAHLLHGAPLVLTTTNGALGQDAPLVCLDRRTSSKKNYTNGAPTARCAISSYNY